MREKREIRVDGQVMCARLYGVEAGHWSVLECLDMLLERGGYVPSRSELEEIRRREREDGGDNTLSSSPEP